MKTTKIIKTFATLSLVFFMSVSSIANHETITTGDIVKSGVKNQGSRIETSISKLASSVENEFNYLRFDVNKFIAESAIADLHTATLDYLRFDVNKYSNTIGNEITELPATNEFEYLRFDVNTYTVNSTSELTELPENEFKYLRFDVNKFTGSNTGITELPVE